MEETSEVQLEAYEEQLSQVKELLEAEPDNEEYLKLAEDLQQLVDLTRQLVSESSESTSTSKSSVPSLPPSPSFSVGQQVLAQFSGDGLCYEAVINAVNLNDSGEVLSYRVTFLGYGNIEDVSPLQVAPSALVTPTPSTSATSNKLQETTTTSRGPKRKIVQLDEEGNVIIPKNIQIQPNDTEEVRATKKKKIHAIKSAGRLQKINEESLQKKNEWNSFVSTKGKQKKTGFFTGRKKESIFKSPDSVHGKVGVIGSGQAMTQDSSLERPKNIPVTKKKLALPTD